jgi:hypothetical protein
LEHFFWLKNTGQVVVVDVVDNAKVDGSGSSVGSKDLFGWHHFCVEVGALAEEAVEVAKVTVRMAHHGSDRK